ncbi:MAG: TetR/AcrR family transcriptional regulator [Lachnospiraceae bacterium]|nr:TetR/AcrR family transcriptional regulator [Lachnospiraceae bacterium]
MPKQKITKEMVVEAAFELARSGGVENISVKEIAQKVGCSVQPIYSYCENMGELRKDVGLMARKFVGEYVAAHVDKKDFFRSNGYAFVKLAYEEPYIFKMFVTTERENIASMNDMYAAESNPQVAEFIAEALHISIEKARVLHLNMLIYNVGIGTILTTATPGIPMEEITQKLETAYEAFLQQALTDK